MDAVQAQRVIESLRKGIPPDGFVRHFTVGRKKEIDDLTQRLQAQDGTVLLLKANYGSGKTHLLRYIREEALDRHYAVSIVTLDSSSAVRFNRMDQIFGAVCRGIEVPEASDNKGLRPFFDLLVKCINKRDDTSIWRDISNNWKWDFSEALDSHAVFVALRAWATGRADAADIVENWFFQPWQYKGQRKTLYLQLIDNLRKFFRDPRSEWKFYADEVFMFHTKGYEQSWAALRDFDRLARAAGLEGMVILFDEYEDVITNLSNVAHQEAAFWNLFHFYNGKSFPGKTFYAVTPAFLEKCKLRLLQKGKWDFDFSRFDALPTYEMSPLTTEQLKELSMRILEAHGIAYDWEPDLEMKASHLKEIVSKAASLRIQDRARHVIVSVVKALDELFQESL
jgi:hypothetical protein